MSLPEFCAAGVVLACAAAIAYILSKPGRPAAIIRSEEGGHTVVRVRAKEDLARVELDCGGDNRARLLRAGLRRGESVEFRIPPARGPVRVIVESSSGQRMMEL